MARAIDSSDSHDSIRPTKNPQRLSAFGVISLQSIQTLVRPYGLPVASVSKESESKGSRFITALKSPGSLTQIQRYIEFSFPVEAGQDWHGGNPPGIPAKDK